MDLCNNNVLIGNFIYVKTLHINQLYTKINKRVIRRNLSNISREWI